MRRRRLLTALLISLLAVACAPEASPPKDKPLSQPGEKLYTLKGRIVARNAGANSLTVDHEAVPGFMEAMAMEYSVRGAKVDSLPPVQAKIEAKLHVTDSSYWLTEVRKAP